MKAAAFLKITSSERRRPWMALGIIGILVFFVAATVFAGGGAPQKQSFTDKLAHVGGKLIDGYTKAKSWVSDKVNKVKGFFTDDPALKYMSQKERRQNEEARQRILKVMKSRRFRTEREKREWQKDLFDDLAKQGIVQKDPNAVGGDGGASQFWYDLEHRSGQFKKISPRALKIDEQLKADDVDYRETSNELGQTRAKMVSDESQKAGEAAIREEKKFTDAATGAGAAKEAIKGKVDEVKKKVEQGKKIADTTQEIAEGAGEHADDVTGKNKTLRENQAYQKELKRRRAAMAAEGESADAGAAPEKEKGEDAGANGSAGLDKERAQKSKSDRGAGAKSAKTAKDNPGRVIDEAGRDIPADEFENGATVVSKNGDEYEKRNGKWEKTGENYGTYNPSPDKGAVRKDKAARDRGPRGKMTSEEWHDKLKENDPEAWEKVKDALESGDPAKVDAVIEALGAEPKDGTGAGDSLRAAEEESGGATAADGTYGQSVASADNPYENPDSWVPAGRQATAAERDESARAADAARMGRIAAQGRSVEQNIANAENQHGSAESAAQGQRQRSSAIADAIVGGLTSGVAAGVDAAAGTIGAGAGNVVAGKITPKDDGDAAGGQVGDGSGAAGAGGTASTTAGSSETPWTGVFKGSFPFRWCMAGKCGKKVMIFETFHIVQHGTRLTGTGDITGEGLESDGDGPGTFQGTCSGRSAHISFGENEDYNITLSGDGRSITIDGSVLRRVSQ